MAFRIVHCNINVTDLNKSIAIYEQALGLQVARKLEAEDGSFTLCYLQDDTGSFQIELTWLKDHPQPYELGENESLAGGCSGIGTCLDIRKHLHFFAGVFICGYR